MVENLNRVVILLVCPNSITSILLKTCLKPGLRHVADKSETKKVGDLVSDKIDLSRHVDSKIEAVEFRNDKRTFRGSQPISSQLVMT